MKAPKIMIYPPSTTKANVLGVNGKVLDNICIQAKTDESIIDGSYTFDGTFLLDDEGLWQSIEEESILKVKMDYGYEVFRIVKPRKNLRDIQVFARQITLEDTLRIQLADVRPTSLNGMAYMEWVLNNSNEYKENKQYAKDLILFSDIPTSNTAYYIEKNLYEAIHTVDNSFMSKWGGEVQRRGYSLKINNRIGINRGIKIRSGKNLVGFEESTNIDNLITRIKPKGFDGITINGYVSSGLIDNYSRVFTKEIKYEDVKVKDENNQEGFDTLAQAQAELVRRATLEFSENNIDQLKAEYKINFIDLSRTEEYKDYEMLERVYLGDDLEVFVEKLGVNIVVRALTRKYDVLRQMHIEVTLSNEDLKKLQNPPTLGQIMGELDKLDEQAKNYLQEAKDHASGLINNGLKNSYVIVRPNEILVMDTKDVNTATKVWRWNNGGLGFSSTGYNGEYGTAITQEGSIVADYITTGRLTANLIRAGVIKGFNDNLIINLDNGAITFKKGLIQGLNSSWNLDNGKIDFKGGRLGNQGLVIDLDNETIKFTKGLIQGDNSSWNLDTGEFVLGGSGNTASHTKDYSRWSHYADGYTEVNNEGFRRNGRPYHSLIEIGTAIVGGSAGAVPREVTIQLPQLWKGREFRVVVQMVDTQGGIEREWVKRVYLKVTNVNIGLGTFTVRGYWTSITGAFSENEKELQFSYIAIGG